MSHFQISINKHCGYLNRPVLVRTGGLSGRWMRSCDQPQFTNSATNTCIKNNTNIEIQERNHHKDAPKVSKSFISEGICADFVLHIFMKVVYSQDSGNRNSNKDQCLISCNSFAMNATCGTLVTVDLAAASCGGVVLDCNTRFPPHCCVWVHMINSQNKMWKKTNRFPRVWP